MMTAHDTGAERRTRLAAARLYLVCDSKPRGRELTDVLQAAIAGGVDVVQLRDKCLSEDELTQAARIARDICKRLGALFIVNDRPAVALAAGADGVHVGQEDMPVAQVRELVGPEMLIGLSTHAPAEIDAAGVRPSIPGESALIPGETASAAVGNSFLGADYIGVGPVHATPTKPGRPAVGLELVRYAAAHARAPFFAIGGIHAGNVASVLEAGARRVAVVRAITDAAEPERAARDLRARLERAGPDS
jgi:thiamine-phosphate pyrophosphorylase